MVDVQKGRKKRFTNATLYRYSFKNALQKQLQIKKSAPKREFEHKKDEAIVNTKNNFQIKPYTQNIAVT